MCTISWTNWHCTLACRWPATPTHMEIPKPSPNSIPQLESESPHPKELPTLSSLTPILFGNPFEYPATVFRLPHFHPEPQTLRAVRKHRRRRFKDPYGDWHCPAEERNENIAEQV